MGIAVRRCMLGLRCPQPIAYAGLFGIDDPARQLCNTCFFVQVFQGTPVQPQLVTAVTAELFGVQALVFGKGFPVNMAQRVALVVTAQTREVIRTSAFVAGLFWLV